MNKIIMVGILGITLLAYTKATFAPIVIRSSYILVFHSDPSVLENRVSSYLRKGYQPSGGVTIDDDGYYQAVFK